MRAALLAATLLALPLAAAGSESEPDVPGLEDLEDPQLDFLGAWLEPDADGVRFTIKVAALDDATADHYYALAFTYAGDRYVAVVAVDRDGDARTDLRPPNFNRQGVRGPEALAGGLRDVDVRRGEPAYVSATIPYSALPDLRPGKVIIDLGAYAGFYDRSRRAWEDVDGRDTTNAYVVQQGGAAGFAQRNVGAVVGGAILATGALAAAVALVVAARRRKPRAAAPREVAPAPPPPPREAPPPEEPRPAGQRFRIDPRK